MKSDNKTGIDIQIRDASETDRESITLLFNRFVRESFAAYSEKEFDRRQMDGLFQSARIFKVLTDEEHIVGFGFNRPYREFENFSHVGMLTYFIQPEYTGKGLGTRLLNILIEEGRQQGNTNFVAHISSKNEQSLAFHKKHDFVECGRLRNMGYKFGVSFDIVWVQKQIKGVQECEHM